MKARVWLLLCLLLAWPLSSLAATRAWLEQTEVSLGQAVTLNVETDAVSATPDLTPLMRDFEVEGQSDSRSVQLVNGRVSSRTTFALTLRPRRTGTLAIPALHEAMRTHAPAPQPEILGRVGPDHFRQRFDAAFQIVGNRFWYKYQWAIADGMPFLIEAALYADPVPGWGYWVFLVHVAIAMELVLFLPFTKFAHAMYRPVSLFFYGLARQKDPVG